MNRFHFHWSAEAYNYGRTFREYYNLPKFLPLPFYSDHGVLPAGILDINILENHIPNSIFLTFSPSIYEKRNQFLTLQILGTLHPWVSYKEQKKLSRRRNPNSVVFFPMHSLPDFQIGGMDDESSCEFLLENFPRESEVVICLHWNDFESPRREYFEDHGFRVITLGNPFDKEYIDRFYNLAANARIAISESWTSAVAYLIDFGVPCSILKREVEIVNTSRPEQLFGKNHEFWSEEVAAAEGLFSIFPPAISEDQILFVKSELGYQYRDNYMRNRKAIRKAYFEILPRWVVMSLLRKGRRIAPRSN